MESSFHLSVFLYPLYLCKTPNFTTVQEKLGISCHSYHRTTIASHPWYVGTLCGRYTSGIRTNRWRNARMDTLILSCQPLALLLACSMPG
jgi:hypothetical protein